MLVSRRTNTILLVLILAVGVGIVAMLASSARGGPLDPPAAPGSTDGVREPGTPISSLPFTASQPGYYYVTRDLTGVAGQDGITIAGSNTTIDLGGFTLTGGAGTGNGITNPGARNIVVRNGAVRFWDNGINLTGTYSRVENIQALSNRVAGIVVGAGSQVADCNASLNFNGIVMGFGSVRNCALMENSNFGIETGGNNSLIERNVIAANAGYGIDMGGSFNKVIDNQMSGNVVKDISIAYGANSNMLTGNLYCTSYDFGTGTVATGNAC